MAVEQIETPGTLSEADLALLKKLGLSADHIGKLSASAAKKAGKSLKDDAMYSEYYLVSHTTCSLCGLIKTEFFYMKNTIWGNGKRLLQSTPMSPEEWNSRCTDDIKTGKREGRCGTCDMCREVLLAQPPELLVDMLIQRQHQPSNGASLTSAQERRHLIDRRSGCERRDEPKHLEEGDE